MGIEDHVELKNNEIPTISMKDILVKFHRVHGTSVTRNYWFVPRLLAFTIDTQLRHNRQIFVSLFLAASGIFLPLPCQLLAISLTRGVLSCQGRNGHVGCCCSVCGMICGFSLSSMNTLIFLSLCTLISSSKLLLHSFEPPFNEVDGSGDRMINKHWRTSGHAGLHPLLISCQPILIISCS